MRQMPTCPKCSQAHWLFVACDDTARIEKDRRALHGSGAPLQIFEHPERRGMRNFGDRLDGVTVKGNVHWLTDGPMKPRGGVIEPDDWKS